MASLAHRVLSAGTLTDPSRIRELIDATQQSLVLDNSFDVLDFATRIQGLAAGNVEFMTVPVLGDGESDSDGAVLKVDPAAIRSFVAASINGGSPPAAAPNSPNTGQVTIDVLNASGVSGLAGAVSQELTGRGFGAGAVSNADTRRVSVVRYPTGGQDSAKAIAKALGGMPTEENPNLKAGTVQIYLGEDYSGPGKNGLAAPAMLRLDGRTATGGAGSATSVVPAVATTSPTQEPPPPTQPVVASNVPCVN